jgi:hypothetical protein
MNRRPIPRRRPTAAGAAVESETAGKLCPSCSGSGRKGDAPCPTCVRRANREKALLSIQPALYKRAQTGRRLNLSQPRIIDLERRGLLDVIRFKKGGDVFHKVEQVEHLAKYGVE